MKGNVQHSTLWRWGARLLMLVALLCLGHMETKAQLGFDPCDSIWATVDYKQDCCWEFTVMNYQGYIPLRNVAANVLSPMGAGVSSASGPTSVTTTSNATSIDWAFPNGFFGTASGLIGCFYSPNGTVTIELVYTLQGGGFGEVHCRDTIHIQCPVKPPHQDCFEIAEQKIDCKPTANGTVYNWSFVFRSLLPCQGTQPALVQVLNPSGITVSPNSFAASSSWTWQNITLSGPGAVPGTVAQVAITVCCVDPATGQQYCCTDTLKIELPDCGCFEIRQDSTWCESIAGTSQKQFKAKFNIRSLLPCSGVQTAYPQVIAPAGVNISPSNFPISNAWQSQTVTFTGPNATPGTVVTVQLTVCCQNFDGTRYCCTDTIQFKLPECPQEPECKDCCKDFPKKFYRNFQWSSSSGYSTVGGYLQAGNTKICTVSATLVSAKINGNPAYGYFIPTNILGSTPGSIPYMHEVTWTGVDVNAAPTYFLLRLRFPALQWSWPWWNSRDVLEYCIRYRFTDANCRTCDTVICYRSVRRPWIFPAPIPNRPGPSIDGKEQSSTLDGEGNPVVRGELLEGNRGRLDVTFPEIPEGIGAVHYAGLRVESAEEGVSIVNAVSHNGPAFSVENGSASAGFGAAQGETVSVDLYYGNLDKRASLDHRVYFRFVFDDTPGDTLEEPITVTFRREGALKGGDEMSGVAADLHDVHTYALHLQNRNGSEEPIERVVIHAGDNAKIVAVGPTSDAAQTVLRLGRIEAEGEVRQVVGEEIGTAAIALQPGDAQSPIYLTLADVDGSATLEFQTLNADGQVISTGTVNLTTPLSGVQGEDSENGPASAVALSSFPNPTHGSATIEFTLPKSTPNVVLTVTDASGREVARLIDGEAIAGGRHGVYFDAFDLPNGTYFYTLRAGTVVETRSMQLTR